MKKVLLTADEKLVAHEKLWSTFRGVKWGASISDTPGMSLVDKSGNTSIYQRESDDLTIEIGSVKLIYYNFYKDRFYFAFVVAEGHSNWLALRDATFAQYGEGEKEKDKLSWTWWVNRGQSNGIFMGLKYDTDTKRTTLSLMHIQIVGERREAIRCGNEKKETSIRTRPS